MDQPLIIDCATCCMRDTSACDDCVVTFLCEREPDDAVVLDVEELRAHRCATERHDGVKMEAWRPRSPT